MRFLLLPLYEPGNARARLIAGHGRTWIGRSCKAFTLMGALTLFGCSEDVAGPGGPDDRAGPDDVPSPQFFFNVEVEADLCLWSSVFPRPCLPVGESAPIRVTVLSVDGDTLHGQPVTFTSGDEEVLTVSTDGVVTAVGLGRAEVAIHVAGRTQTISILTLAWLPISGSAVVYEEAGADPGELVLRSGEVRYRYVLRQDGTFELQTSAGSEWGGTYSDGDITIAFDFDNADWAAIGTIQEDSMSVEYNLSAQFDDFRNGIYLLASTTNATGSITSSSRVAPTGRNEAR